MDTAEPISVAASGDRQNDYHLTAEVTGDVADAEVQSVLVAPADPPAVAVQSPGVSQGVAEMDLAQLRQHFRVRDNRRSRRMYVVRRGDNLTRVARKTLNDDSRDAIMKIYNANRRLIPDISRLRPGIELIIP